MSRRSKRFRGEEPASSTMRREDLAGSSLLMVLLAGSFSLLM